MSYKIKVDKIKEEFVREQYRQGKAQGRSEVLASIREKLSIETLCIGGGIDNRKLLDKVYSILDKLEKAGGDN